MENKIKFSICIPTYNRKLQLLNTLKRLISQQNIDNAEIIIINNNSDYNVEQYLRKELLIEFTKTEITVINNKHNVGGAINIMNCFSASKTEWMWLLSDDDDPDPLAISNILEKINKYSDCSCIKFSQEQNLGNDVVIEGLYQFLDYMDKKLFSKGSLMFMSNSLFNVEKLGPYISYGFQYLTLTPHLVPLTMFLDNENGKIALINEKIVEQKPPVNNTNDTTYLNTLIWEKYNFTTALLPINLKSNKKYFNKYIKYFSSDSFLGNFLSFLNAKDRKDCYNQYKVLYENSYKFLRFREKAMARLFLFILSNWSLVGIANIVLPLVKPNLYKLRKVH